MAVTISKRTLILSIIVLILALVVFVVLPGRKQPAAQATPTAVPTATLVPWWASEQGSRGAGEQGSQGAEEQRGPSAPLRTGRGAEEQSPLHLSTPAPLHRVQPGETLGAIATQHGTTVQELVALNVDRYPSLATDPGTIRVGWELVVSRGP